MAINRFFPSLAILLLSGCSMGPDFVMPQATAAASWFRPSVMPGGAGTLKESEPVAPNWWSSLNDPLLNRLIERVAKENIDLLTATERLRESRAQRGIAAADLFPSVNGDASYTRQKLSDKGVISLVGGGGAGAGQAQGGAMASQSAQQAGIPSSAATPAFNIYQYGFDASWEIDLWGRVRRTVEAADALREASEYARRAIDISVTAELVSDYVQLRGTQKNREIAEDTLAVARQVAILAEEKVKWGLGSDLDVASALAQAAGVTAQLAPLKQQQANLMNAIALLLAQEPGALEAELSSVHPIPPVPPTVPVGVPSDLLKRRPDIGQAEAQLHAATAQIGAAKADFFPKITLMGNGALQALEFNELNSWAAHSYSFGPSVTLPIFEGGRLTSTLALRNVQQREAALNYRKTILNAFHEVDNALTAFKSEQERHIALMMTVRQNERAFSLAQERYKRGLASFLEVLDAQRTLLAARQQEVMSQQAQSVAMVQLYKALGGGWETDFPLHK